MPDLVDVLLIVILLVLIVMLFVQKRTTRELTTLLEQKNALLVKELEMAIEDSNKESKLLISQKMAEASDKQFEKFSMTQDRVDEQLRKSREETNKRLDVLTENIESRLNSIQRSSVESAENTRNTVDKKLESLMNSNEKRLDEMRLIVEEKLEKTLQTRLTESFKAVSTSLDSVQKGLGEMQGLAKDARDLKNVLSNVKQRGIIGEVLLGSLLSDILAPSQYEENVEIESGRRVEFVVKLPGQGDTPLLLPIDSKFPDAAYQRLMDAEDKESVEKARKELYTSIKTFAKDISTKYIVPPKTTDFAILFLPTEGLYAEVVRNTALFEELRREYKVVVTGATTLSALLSSLKIGFKTLTIEKRSAEVWETLGKVKKAFGDFSVQLEKAQKNLQTAEKTIATLSGTRTRAIERVLRGVEELEIEDMDEEKYGIGVADFEEHIEEN